MRNKLYIILYKIWLYILNKLYIIIVNRIKYDKENLYVVYLSNIINDIYICKDGESALELVELYKKLNIKLNRNFTQVLYGKVNLVFKYKMVKISDLCFTFDATDEQRRDVCKYIADVPLLK
jgi:hypothetical protein